MVVREKLLMKKIKKREEKKRALTKKNKPEPEAVNSGKIPQLNVNPHGFVDIETCSI